MSMSKTRLCGDAVPTLHTHACIVAIAKDAPPTGVRR